MDILYRLRIEASREPYEPIWREAMDEIQRLRKAINVIDTWAAMSPEIDSSLVRKMCREGRNKTN